MQFTQEHEELRRTVRNFVEKELNPHVKEWEEAGRFPIHEVFKKMGDLGLLGVTKPTEFGGMGLDYSYGMVMAEEMGRTHCGGVPLSTGVQTDMATPALARFGSDELRQNYLAPAIAGDTVASIAVSEPHAGSDVAAIKTTATKDGDDYVINGTKIWTSYAALADHCFLLARVGSGEAGSGSDRAGIAIFLVPMSTAGIQVRAIPSLIGHGDIHETFFTDVRIPATARLGAEGEGWSIIAYALANERVGIPRYQLSARVLDGMVADLAARGRFDNPVIRSRAGAAFAACEAARMLVYRVVDQRARGAAPGPESNIARVAVIAADHAVTDFGLDFLPHSFSGDGVSTGGDPDLLAHHERAIVAGIAAGAAEIQLGLIARRHLDLPREAP